MENNLKSNLRQSLGIPLLWPCRPEKTRVKLNLAIENNIMRVKSHRSSLLTFMRQSLRELLKCLIIKSSFSLEDILQTQTFTTSGLKEV